MQHKCPVTFFAQQMLELWYQALNTEHGILLDCFGELTRVKAALYKARADSGDPKLANLSIRVYGTKLAIVKKSEPKPDA